VRQKRLIGALERALLGAAMSLAAMLADWVLTRRMAKRRER
jgi:hypothetical protein